MRKLYRVLVAALILSFSVVSGAEAQAKLEKLWLTEGLRVPESVFVYRDDRSSYLFVSQIDGDPSIVDGQGAIAKMSLKGEIIDAEWVKGLDAPKGMGVFGGKLYVADITRVVVINIKKAEIEKKINIPGAVFLNDISIDQQGVVYVSDTRTGKVHRINGNKADDYLTSLENANGLRTLGSTLIVGAGTHLYLVDKGKNRLQIATGFAQAIDGVDSINRGDFIVSCWQGLIYYVHLDGKLDLLLDSQAAKINTADISYDQETQTLYVPNFSKNSVTAYKVNMK
jgi:hypothetical protein